MCRFYRFWILDLFQMYNVFLTVGCGEKFESLYLEDLA